MEAICLRRGRALTGDIRNRKNIDSLIDWIKFSDCPISSTMIFAPRTSITMHPFAEHFQRTFVRSNDAVERE